MHRDRRCKFRGELTINLERYTISACDTTQNANVETLNVKVAIYFSLRNYRRSDFAAAVRTKTSCRVTFCIYIIERLIILFFFFFCFSRKLFFLPWKQLLIVNYVQFNRDLIFI